MQELKEHLLRRDSPVLVHWALDLSQLAPFLVGGRMLDHLGLMPTTPLKALRQCSSAIMRFFLDMRSASSWSVTLSAPYLVTRMASSVSASRCG